MNNAFKLLFPNHLVHPAFLTLSLCSRLVASFRHSADIPQLHRVFTVKVLTNHESCQYGGPLIRVWPAHESCHICVSAWSSSGAAAVCVMAGLWLCEQKLMVGQMAWHTQVLSDPFSTHRCEQCFGSSQRGADPNLWIWYQLVAA